MKNATQKIAMLLIVVMIANSFTGCVIIGKGYDFYGPVGKLAIAIDVCLLIGIIFGIVLATSDIKINNERLRRGPRRTNPYLFENNTLTTTISSLPEEELSSLTEAFYFLPDKELNLFIDRLNFMSKKESVSLMNSINFYSEQEIAAIIGTFNSMSKKEKLSTIESLNSLPKTVSLASIVRSNYEK